jgi:hypothetical protein
MSLCRLPVGWITMLAYSGAEEGTAEAGSG